MPAANTAMSTISFLDAPAGIRPEAVLKNLPREKQDAIILYLDGDSDQQSHSHEQTVAWVKKEMEIETQKWSLSEFCQWYRNERFLEQTERSTQQVLARGREEGWLKSAEDEIAAGQVFFTRLAIDQKDSQVFERILRGRDRGKSVALMERRIKLLEEREAKLRQVAAEPTMTVEERKAAMAEILGLPAWPD
jgi:hypothetical protein